MQSFKNRDSSGSFVSFLSFSIDTMRDFAISKGVCTGLVLVQAFSRHSSLGRLDWIYVGGYLHCAVGIRGSSHGTQSLSNTRSVLRGVVFIAASMSRSSMIISPSIC